MASATHRSRRVRVPSRPKRATASMPEGGPDCGASARSSRSWKASPTASPYLSTAAKPSAGAPAIRAPAATEARMSAPVFFRIRSMKTRSSASAARRLMSIH